jgi:hypothetical protein
MTPAASVPGPTIFRQRMLRQRILSADLAFALRAMLSRIQAMGWHGIVDPGQSGCPFRIVGSQAQQYSVSRR